MAEREGFEPPVGCPTTVFKTAALSHSAISPIIAKDRTINYRFNHFQRISTGLKSLVFALLVVSQTISAGNLLAETADLQFFGDVLITNKSLYQTDSKDAAPSVFGDSLPLLNSAKHNIVNLEGVVAGQLPRTTWKQFFLRMPPRSARVLRSAGIDIVTLANNHSMDFGFPGLLSTLMSLARADIRSTGAGMDLAAASKPLIIELEGRSVCLLAFSKTLPESFWATNNEAGTAFASEKLAVTRVKDCSDRGLYTVVSLHWGQEGQKKAAGYQRELAQSVIDAGADLVIGHHPHVVQDIESYKGKPIFYSLGNFAFGTEPAFGGQEGLAVRVTFAKDVDREPLIEAVPLAVSNQIVHFVPRPIEQPAPPTLGTSMPDQDQCRWQQDRWICAF